MAKTIYEGTAYSDFIVGSEGDDKIFGWDDDDILAGNGGHDDLYGGGGSDWLQGGEGDDWLIGDAGYASSPDNLDGGNGIDTASYKLSPVGVAVSLYHHFARYGDAEGDVLSNIENLEGSAYNDTLQGDDNANVLAGLGGNDSLKGFGGADEIHGGDGNDVLYGMNGNDALYGDGGNDTLYGGPGGDTLTGGSGSDLFLWTSTWDSVAWSSDTMDVITDFNRWEGDLINVSSIDADTTVAGDQAFTFIGTSSFTAPGQISYLNFWGETFIMFNTDADSSFEAAIRLEGLHTPSASWFML